MSYSSGVMFIRRYLEVAMPSESPAVAQMELIQRIREQRRRLGYDAAAVAKSVSIAPANWSHVEAGRRMLTVAKLDILCDYLEFTEPERKRLLELRALAKERSWYHDYSALLSDELLRFHGLEFGARKVRSNDSLLVPGLLQTREYAHALISSDTTFIPQAQVKQRVALRLRRQERLRGDDRVEIIAVASEAALYQRIGGIDVLRGQIMHLIQLLETCDNVDLRLIPFSAESGIHNGATFYLLDFHDSTVLPTIGWHESPGVAGLLEDASTVQALDVIHERALVAALSRAETLDLIRETARKIG